MMESFATFFNLIKQKYSHIKGIKDIASATLKLVLTPLNVFLRGL